MFLGISKSVWSFVAIDAFDCVIHSIEGYDQLIHVHVHILDVPNAHILVFNQIFGQSVHLSLLLGHKVHVSVKISKD